MSSPAAQLAFLTNLQRVLDEGGFVSTYKFALLLAIADLSVERGSDSDRPLRLSTEEIAEKFLGYFWRQVAPFPAARAVKRCLRRGGRFARGVLLSLLSLALRRPCAELLTQGDGEAQNPRAGFWQG